MNFNFSKSNKPPVTKRVEKRRKSLQLSSPPRRHSTAVDHHQSKTLEISITAQAASPTRRDTHPSLPTRPVSPPRRSAHLSAPTHASLPTRPARKKQRPVIRAPSIRSKDVIVGPKPSEISEAPKERAPVRRELIDRHYQHKDEIVRDSLFMTPPPAPMLPMRSPISASLVDHKIQIQNSVDAGNNEPSKESLFMTPPPCDSDMIHIKPEPKDDSDSGISGMDEHLPDTPQSQENCSPAELPHDFDQILKEVAGSHMKRTWEIISDTLCAALHVQLSPDETRWRYFNLMKSE